MGFPGTGLFILEKLGPTAGPGTLPFILPLSGIQNPARAMNTIRDFVESSLEFLLRSSYADHPPAGSGLLPLRRPHRARHGCRRRAPQTAPGRRRDVHY